MSDFEKLFTLTLHGKLKDRITGKIFVKVIQGDILFVRIISYGDTKYEYRLENFSERILNGMSTEYVAYDVTKGFEHNILKKYFH